MEKTKLNKLTNLQMEAAQKVLSLRALSKSGMITTRPQSQRLRALTDANLIVVAEYLRDRTDENE